MTDTAPWYRQFWPWFLIALPASVVVAGLTTWWIAERGADHLVVADYYKEGLAINRELEKEQQAQRLGLSAEVEMDAGMVHVRLTGDSEPPALRLLFAHPLDAGKDFELVLPRTGPGLYTTQLQQALEHRWLWRVEPLQVDLRTPWRIDGEITFAPTYE